MRLLHGPHGYMVSVHSSGNEKKLGIIGKTQTFLHLCYSPTQQDCAHVVHMSFPKFPPPLAAATSRNTLSAAHRANGNTTRVLDLEDKPQRKNWQVTQVECWGNTEGEASGFPQFALFSGQNSSFLRLHWQYGSSGGRCQHCRWLDVYSEGPCSLKEH